MDLINAPPILLQNFVSRLQFFKKTKFFIKLVEFP